MNFEIISEISQVEIIAVGLSIRDLPRLNKTYGSGRWRKLKGIATIRLANGSIRLAELHWYEAHGIGKLEIKRTAIPNSECSLRYRIAKVLTGKGFHSNI